MQLPIFFPIAKSPYFIMQSVASIAPYHIQVDKSKCVLDSLRRKARFYCGECALEVCLEEDLGLHWEESSSLWMPTNVKGPDPSLCDRVKFSTARSPPRVYKSLFCNARDKREQISQRTASEARLSRQGN
jgi:hypothetical protein